MVVVVEVEGTFAPPWVMGKDQLRWWDGQWQ
jgi:hypothetical protein